MRRVAALPCAICDALDLGETPAEVHHLFDQAARSDFLTAPLCPEHHRGASGFHGLKQRGFERVYRLTEFDLLAWTIEQLEG